MRWSVADRFHISARDAFSGLRSRTLLPPLRIDASRLFRASGVAEPSVDAFTVGAPVRAGATRGRGADRAIEWASQQAGSVSFARSGTQFVSNAFRSAGVELSTLAQAHSVNEAFERYLHDGKIRDGALIPRGALVFWQGGRRDGHVAISLGNGSVIDGGRAQPTLGSRVWTIPEISRLEGRGPTGWLLP